MEKENEKYFIIVLLVVLFLGGMVIGVYLGQYQKHTEWSEFYEEIEPLCDLESKPLSDQASAYLDIFKEELEE